MISPAVISTLTELALNKRVQNAASTLVGRVYGKVFANSSEVTQETTTESKSLMTVEELAERIERLPNSDELATAFALLQTDIDRQHRLTRLTSLGCTASIIAVVVGSSWL